jgi:hypothetical protein
MTKHQKGIADDSSQKSPQSADRPARIEVGGFRLLTAPARDAPACAG